MRSKLDKKILSLIQEEALLKRFRVRHSSLAPILATLLLLDKNHQERLIYQAFFTAPKNDIAQAETMVVYLIRETLQYVNGMKPKLFPAWDVSTKRQQLGFATVTVMPSRMEKVSDKYISYRQGSSLTIFGKHNKISVPVAKVVLGFGRLI